MTDGSGEDSVSRAASRPESRRPASNPGSGLTVLVVEDEEPVRTLIGQLLADAGHTILEADRGAEALRAASAYGGPIDLVITDVYMPGLRGPEIVNLLRPKHPAISALYILGYGDGGVARSGVSPDSGFLRKPFTTQEFNDAVARATGTTAEDYLRHPVRGKKIRD